MSDIEKPGPDFSGAGPVEYQPAESRRGKAIESLLASEESRLLSVPGVVSVGIGLSSPGSGVPGREVITVGVVDAEVAARLPQSLSGTPVVVTVTGPVDALRRP